MTKQNAISNHGVNVSIFDKYHRNIIFGKINIRVPPPPIYVQEVWNNKKPNIKNIKKAASNFNWNKSFKNISTDEKVELLS